MGKNTMIRKAIRNLGEEHPGLLALLPYIELNIGLCFTSQDPADIRTLLLANRVEAPAKAGSIAPKDVMIPAGPTTMGPEKTSFFQALNIPTKIAKGNIEIQSDVHIIRKVPEEKKKQKNKEKKRRQRKYWRSFAALLRRTLNSLFNTNQNCRVTRSASRRRRCSTCWA